MQPQSGQRESAAALHRRLLSPANAKPDAGIDLKRKIEGVREFAPTALIPIVVAKPPPIAPPSWIEPLAEFNELLRNLSGIKDPPSPLPPPPAEPTRLIIRTIRMVVADHCGVSIDDMAGPSRHRPYTRPRFIAMHLSSRMTSASLVLIGHYFGDRDHTTVLNAIRRVQQWVTDSAEIAAEVDGLAKKIRSLRQMGA